MQLRPRRLNGTVAALFMVGSAGFALGSVPAYASAVGAPADALTFFASSIFFTSASFGQLVQAQSPAMQALWPAGDVGSGDTRLPARLLAWLPHDRAWLAAVTQFPGTLFFNVTTATALIQGLSAQKYDRVVWRPDFFGSVLFLVSSVFAILATGRLLAWRPRSSGWRIAWLNMIGSIAFMASAVGAFVLPKTGAPISLAWADAGTFTGAVCFFAAAWLTIPQWSAAARARGQARRRGPRRRSVS
jgi:hypothetical protein